MTRTVRSRRAEPASQPLYARVLRLRHLAPSGLLCFVFLEGAVVLGVLLALAELVSWWGVLVLPLTVALMVKFNDLVAGTFAAGPVATETATARATVLRPAAMGPAAAGFTTTSPAATGPAATGPAVTGAAAMGPAAGAPRAVYGGYAHSDEFGASGAFGSPAEFPASSGYGSPAGLSASSGYGSPAGFPSGGAGVQPGDVPHGVQPAGHVRAAYGQQAQAGYGLGQAGHGQGQAGYRPAQTTDGAAAETVVQPAVGGGAVRRPWAEQLDVRQQVAHQAAARRYE